jgi:hypothetical protein
MAANVESKVKKGVKFYSNKSNSFFYSETYYSSKESIKEGTNKYFCSAVDSLNPGKYAFPNADVTLLRSF